MTAAVVSVTLSEWQTLTPADSPDLAGLSFDSIESRQVSTRLNESGMLRLTELRGGIEISAFSHVGRVRVGDLHITIFPKLNTTSLLRLLRYAYGFRRLELVSDSMQTVAQHGFEDLLISQLNSEVQELVVRGLQRAYLRQDEQLASPRGRIDVSKLVRDGGNITTTLPCQHYPRVEDTILNRILLAGLRLAGSLTSLVQLRRESRRLASLMEERVSSTRLDGAFLDRADRQLTRLTTAYVPALSIIRILVEAQGIVLDGKRLTSSLPGFLFDMNRFFQALLSRFLRENLPNYTVRDERGLRGMIRYNREFNPRGRQSPTPRPDYVIIHNGTICAILDAKYRDLWERSLPREMLYQLVVYAMSQQRRPQSTILYPTLTPRAAEARIDVSDPLRGEHLGQICLRPVDLDRLEQLVSSEMVSYQRGRAAYAQALAFGSSDQSEMR